MTHFELGFRALECYTKNMDHDAFVSMKRSNFHSGYIKGTKIILYSMPYHLAISVLRNDVSLDAISVCETIFFTTSRVPTRYYFCQVCGIAAKSNFRRHEIFSESSINLFTFFHFSPSFVFPVAMLTVVSLD